MNLNFNDLQNLDINKSMKLLIFISFVVQWSFLSMVINLFTLWLFRLPLFVIFILDALSMFIIKNKTLKRPSFILSQIWNLIDVVLYRNGNNYSQGYRNDSGLSKTINNLSIKINKTINKIKKFFHNYNEGKMDDKKYERERELNKFSNEIGKTITIEYTSTDNKLKKKKFEYKDRATTFINILESKGYKDYTKYNIDPTLSQAYIIFNKKKDLINVSENKIHLKHDDKDYKFVTDGWPKK